MSNEKNLKPFNKETAKYYGKKGGIQSGIVRTERKTMKEQFQTLLSLQVSDKNQFELLKQKGFNESEINNQLLIISSIFEKALNGDVKAFECISKIIQKEDIEKNNNSIDELNNIFKI